MLQFPYHCLVLPGYTVIIKYKKTILKIKKVLKALENWTVQYNAAKYNCEDCLHFWTFVCILEHALPPGLGLIYCAANEQILVWSHVLFITMKTKVIIFPTGFFVAVLNKICKCFTSSNFFFFPSSFLIWKNVLLIWHMGNLETDSWQQKHLLFLEASFEYLDLIYVSIRCIM